MLSPRALVVLIWFLGFSTAASRAWGPGRPESEVSPGRTARRSVLSWSSTSSRAVLLLDDRERISPRYPNFRRLARETHLVSQRHDGRGRDELRGAGTPLRRLEKRTRRREATRPLRLPEKPVLPAARPVPHERARGGHRPVRLLPDGSWRSRADTLADGIGSWSDHGWSRARARRTRCRFRRGAREPGQDLARLAGAHTGRATLNVLHIELPTSPGSIDATAGKYPTS